MRISPSGGNYFRLAMDKGEAITLLADLAKALTVAHAGEVDGIVGKEVVCDLGEERPGVGVLTIRVNRGNT